MNTSLLRRTLDPILAALAATFLCALMAQGQIVVLPPEHGVETHKTQFKLRVYENHRLSPDVISEQGTLKKPIVDKALVEKLTRIRSAIPAVASSYYMVPGSSN